MQKIDCKKIREHMMNYFHMCQEQNEFYNAPIVFVQPPDDPRAASYIKSKSKTLKELGFCPITVKAPKYVDTAWMNRFLDICDDVPILVQLPFPDTVNMDSIFEKHRKFRTGISDVDCLGLANRQKFFDQPLYTNLRPCTVEAVNWVISDELFHGKIDLDKYEPGYTLSGKVITIIGRGKLVGEPLARLLHAKGATLQLCNSGTPKHIIEKYMQLSDIVISCVGKHGIIDEYMFLPDQNVMIIDVGIEVIDGKVKGDFRYNPTDIENRLPNLKFTPSVGGVGPLTVAVVGYNALLCCNEVQKVVEKTGYDGHWTNSLFYNPDKNTVIRDSLINKLKREEYDIDE